MKHFVLYVAVFLCLSSAHAFAAKDEIQKLMDRFQLFTNCEAIYVLVEGLSADASKIGLTKESIQNAVESRLRSARIFSTTRKMSHYLYVNVNVAGRTVSSSLEFYKLLSDPFTGTKGFATTWVRGMTGTHGNRVGRILSGLSRHLDNFLTEFLRVNDETCRKKH